MFLRIDKLVGVRWTERVRGEFPYRTIASPFSLWRNPVIGTRGYGSGEDFDSERWMSNSPRRNRQMLQITSACLIVRIVFVVLFRIIIIIIKTVSMRVCLSVRPSVGPSVGPPVGLSVRYAFVKIAKSIGKWLYDDVITWDYYWRPPALTCWNWYSRMCDRHIYGQTRSLDRLMEIRRYI